LPLSLPSSIPDAPKVVLRSARFLTIIAAQLVFGFGWSLFLVSPKFLTQVLGASAADIGATSATVSFAAALGVAFVTTRIDRTRRRNLYFLGASLLAVCSLGFLAVDRLGPLVYLLQAGIGASFVLAFNATMALVADAAPPERLGQAFGIQGAANLSMNAVSSAVAESVADRFGWRAVFMIAAGSAVVSLLFGFAIREEDPQGAADQGRAPYGDMARLFVVSALIGATFTAMFTFQQPYALSLGARKVSSFFVGFTVAALVMRLGFGGLSDKLGRRRVLLASLCVYAAVPLAIARMRVGLLWAYGAGLGTAHGVLYPTLNAVAAERSAPRARGRILAVLNGSFNAGGALGATAWGLIAERVGYSAVFLFASAVSALSFGVLLRDSPARSPIESQEKNVRMHSR
jgi:MFS family permease